MKLQLRKRDGEAPEAPDEPAAEAPESEAPASSRRGLRRELTMPTLRRKAGDAPKGPERLSFASTERTRRGRWFGVDLDGTTVRVAEVHDGTAIAFTTYQGTTLVDAFKQFAATKPSGTVVVAWNPANVHVQRVPLPQLPLEAVRAGVLDALEDDLPFPVAAATPGIRVMEGPDGVQTAIVAAVESEHVAALWRSLGTADVHLVPAPLLFELDGLYLGLRSDDAQLTLVAGGAVVAARPLSVGGLRKLFGQLDDDVAVAAERFGTVARGGARLDPAAAAVVESYASGVGDEVRRTVDFWARQGHTVPSEVLVHGPGIVVPNLAGRLLDAALFAKPVHLPDVGLEAIARNERPMAFVALAAASFDVRAQTLASLPDPRAAELARHRRESSKRSKRVAAVVGCVVLAAAVLHLPVRSAEGTADDAEAELTEITAQAGALNAVRTLNQRVKGAADTYRKLVTGEPNWPLLLQQITESMPTVGTTVRSITVGINEQDRMANLEFSATMPGRDFRVTVSAWLRELERRGAVKPWSGSFQLACVEPPATQAPPPGPSDTCPPGKVSQVTAAFRVPFPLSDGFVVQRPVPGAPATPSTPAAGPTTTTKGAGA